jgi:hypothetical protein
MLSRPSAVRPGTRVDPAGPPPLAPDPPRDWHFWFSWVVWGPAGPPLLALVTTLVCLAVGWQGTDVTAQVYRVNQVRAHGLSWWDPGWYGGTYPLGYSVVYPPLAAVFGLWPVTAAAAMTAAASFDRMVVRLRGRRPLGSWYFAVLTLLPVAIGQLPYLIGEAFGLAALFVLMRPTPRRLALGFFLGVLSALSSPVAGAFLALALVAWGMVRTARRFLFLGAGVGTLALIGIVSELFHTAGTFPFGLGDVVVVVAISVVVAAFLPLPPVVRLGAALYGVVTVGLYLVHTPVGDNDARLASYCGIPLILCFLPEMSVGAAAARLVKLPRLIWQVLTVVAVAGLVLWNWSPGENTLQALPSNDQAFYQPLLAEMAQLDHGLPQRLEIPPLSHHGESAYVAPTIPLARGWERQLDQSDDPIFYQGPLTATTYRAWLLNQGVSWVAMASAPLDYAARAEGALLRSGTVPGLTKVWSQGAWTIWKVEGATGIASAPGLVTSLSADGVTVALAAAASVTLRLHWSRYWALPASSHDCIGPGPDGWTELTAPQPGSVHLHVAILGANHGACPAAR